jgi:hypothetical protein
MFVSSPLARFSGEIPSRFCGFSRRYGQENFRPAFWRRGRRGVRLRSTGADFSFASSDFKALGACFCNFPIGSRFRKPLRGIHVISIGYTESKPNSFLQLSHSLSARVAHGQPRARVPHLVGSQLSRPYHFRARIQSFQAVAAPFPGDSVSLSHHDPGDRNASAQKIDDRLGGHLRAAAQERLGSHPKSQVSKHCSPCWARDAAPTWPGSKRSEERKNTIACL